MKYITLILLALTTSARWVETSRPQLHSLGTAVDSQVYWAGLRRTTDAGQTWKRLELDLQPLPFSFLKTFFVTSERGWITSAQDGTYQTEDGGEHWQRILKESAVTIAFADTLNGWLQTLSGEEGIYYRTQDSGRSWSRCGQGVRLKSVSYPDKDYVYGVSEDGWVWRSTDGGCNFTHWRAGYYLVSFSSVDKGVIVGDAGMVYLDKERELKIRLPDGAGEVYSAYFLDSRQGWILVLPEDEGDTGVYEWVEGVWHKVGYELQPLPQGWKEGALQMLLIKKSVNLSP